MMEIDNMNSMNKIYDSIGRGMYRLFVFGILVLFIMLLDRMLVQFILFNNIINIFVIEI